MLMTYATIIDIMDGIGGASWTKETEEDRMAQGAQTVREDRTEQEDLAAQEDRLAQEDQTDRMCQEQAETHRIENAVERIPEEGDNVLLY